MENYESEIVESLRGGDVKSLEYIFDLYFLALTRYACRFVPDEDHAKDMVQEVFVNVWKNREFIYVDRSLEAFLYTAVKNQCLNFLKHQKVKDKYHDVQGQFRDIEIRYYECETDQEIWKNDLENRLNLALDTLSDKSRQIFRKSRFEGKRNKDIAREMNISLKAVEKHITSAIRILRKYLY